MSASTAHRALPLAVLLIISQACSPAPSEISGTRDITVRIRLAGNRDLGSTPGRVYVYSMEQTVTRGQVAPFGTPFCQLDVTPEKHCTFTVPRANPVTLIVAEPDPLVQVRLAPRSESDTVRDGTRVEFTGWTDCPQSPDVGECVIRSFDPPTIEANFQLMQQVTVYQSGAGGVDWVMNAAGPMLKIPPEQDNILDLAGCRRLLSAPDMPCDTLHLFGAEPWHRLTAWVPRKTLVRLFPSGGAETSVVSWDGDCPLGPHYGPTVCAFTTPEVSGEPILITLHLQWWDCGGEIMDHDVLGSCVLMGGEPPQRRIPPSPIGATAR